MANENLTYAKEAKNNEFYTIFSDIEAEMNAYFEYDSNVFRDKTILLPCDDPEWSNFTRYFATNFERFGIKKLISTSYAKGLGNKQITIFELNSPQYDEKKHEEHGKLFTLTKDTDGSGRVDIDDIEFNGYLQGDGDFRSDEVTALRDEADIIITNPPFSLFREFVSWIMEGKKQFIIIGNQNNISYKEFFPLLMNDKIWLGYSHPKEFIIPEHTNRKNTYVSKDGTIRAKFGNACWFTNIDLERKHKWLPLDTMAHNLKFNKKLKKFLEEYGYTTYPHYDNYDAIEVKFIECIPSDYDGMMGVPLSFLDKYNPEQFEILGMPTAGSNENSLNLNKNYKQYIGYKPNGEKTGRTGSTFGACPVFERNDNKSIYYTNGKRTVQAGSCERIFIKKREAFR